MRDRRIDAWRGISIFLVMGGPLVFYRYHEFFPTSPFHSLSWDDVSGWLLNAMLRFAAPLPGLGVSFFFMISGYLITMLLLKEGERNGQTSISAVLHSSGIPYLARVLDLPWDNRAAHGSRFA
jgi:peptidoglycan/LPS O-acetylase OafA/YrhL